MQQNDIEKVYQLNQQLICLQAAEREAVKRPEVVVTVNHTNVCCMRHVSLISSIRAEISFVTRKLMSLGVTEIVTNNTTK